MRNKWICIKETCFLTLHHMTCGGLYADSHYIGDIVEVEGGLIYFTDIDNEIYVGSLAKDRNWYDVEYHNEPILKEYFMPYDKWLALNREEQMKMILDE